MHQNPATSFRVCSNVSFPLLTCGAFPPSYYEIERCPSFVMCHPLSVSYVRWLVWGSAKGINTFQTRSSQLVIPGDFRLVS